MAVVTHNGRVTVGKTSQGKTNIPTEPEATEYERQLNNAELTALAITTQDRVQLLLSQGMPLPMQEIENHHIIGLLEQFVGPEDALRVREWHLSWLDRMLDKAEAAVRIQVSGLLDGLPTRS